jgi:cytochrome c oxidase cbb3-type subunit 1
VTLWITGIQQGAMWKALTPEGTLKYTFMEGLVKNYPYWHVRALGGTIFIVGMVVFVLNVLLTIQKGRALEASGRTAAPATA